MRATIFAVILAGIAQGASAPALPFLDWKACPFEGCSYKNWNAKKSMAVYDTWKENRHEVQQLSAGEQVNGLTGVVITFQPGIVRLDRDLPLNKLKAGDTILVYASRGEGFYGVFVNGKYEPEFDLSFAKRMDGSGCGGAHCAATFVDNGKQEWWANIKLSSGATGWVLMNTADFDGLDLRS